jgi:hypothetical protein
MLRKSQLILAALLVIVASGTVSYAVSASMPQALLGAGTTRYAVASSVSSELTFTNVYHTVPGMSVDVDIPGGKVGDIFVIFCADAYADSLTALQVRAWISGFTGTPGYTNFQEEPVIESHCATWYRIGVGPGIRNVAVQWRSSNDGHAINLYQRNMIVIVNIR